MSSARYAKNGSGSAEDTDSGIDGKVDKPAFASSMMNGFRVIEAFSIEHPVLGVTEIAERVGMHKSTVSRTLTTLREAGYVERDPDSGRFRLGLGIISLAGPILAHLDVRRAALPILEDATEVTRETTALTVWNRDEAIVVEQVTSPRQVMQQASIGTRYHRFESSSVRVFLAYIPEHKAKDVYRTSIRRRSDTPISMNEFTDELALIRSQGYAINDGLTSAEETGISAPVHDFRGSVVGAITLSAPRFRINPDRLHYLAEQIVTSADSLSSRLGFHQ